MNKRGRFDDNITPQFFKKSLEEQYGEMFDPCPLYGNEDEENNGLKIDWKKVNFVHPPFSDPETWIMKAILEKHKGNTSIMLIPVKTHAKYWSKYIAQHADKIRYVAK